VNIVNQHQETCRHVKADRNPHEVSSDEDPHTQSLDEQKRGGGHRSGSCGAGTQEEADTTPRRRSGPQGWAGSEQHP
jgi:hypothetical protein